ncbi:MAG: bifunctional oligoribonuclease/PAP phosphatase NrnA [bacterium]
MNGNAGAGGKIINPSQNPEVFKKLSEMIRRAGTFALFGHINPDGDSVGAILAFSRILRGMGKEVRLFSPQPAPAFLRFLPGAGEIETEAPKDLDVDLAVALDCGGENRAGKELVPALKRAGGRVNIDHHASNEAFGDINIVDPDATSTCEIIFRFAKHEGAPIDEQTATCLYTGIMYDTGRFKHPTTTPEAFRICSELVDAGAKPSEIAVKVFDGRSLAHLKLLGAALSNMKVEEGGGLVWSAVSKEQFGEMEATSEDAEGVVDVLGSMDGCEVFMFITGLPDGKVRVSLRAKGAVDVSAISAENGGGGHRSAAGFRSTKPIGEVIEKVVGQCVESLRKARGGGGNGAGSHAESCA